MEPSKSSQRTKKTSRHLFAIGLTLVFFVSTTLAQEAPHETTSHDLSHVIPVADLEEHLTTDNGIARLKRDFYNVSTGQRKPWTEAAKPVNLPKNRYDDLLAYDATRVVLDILPADPESDYINANYIDGYNRDREYVATQGPLPSTINDFWRMVWNLNTRKIVMLANVYEHGKMKVAKYWPDTNGSYGEFQITKLSEHNISAANQVLRKFSIKKIQNPFETRVIRHFHFTGWPDFGVPEDRRAVVSLVEQAKKFRSDDTVPLIVHCSAGVGRTGTIILTDSMLEKARAENKVDYLKRLNHMRDQRIDVVEKEGQYMFAHQAVNDVMNNPETAKYFDDIDKQYQRFDEIDANNNIASEPLTSGASRLPNHLHKLLILFVLRAIF